MPSAGATTGSARDSELVCGPPMPKTYAIINVPGRPALAALVAVALFAVTACASRATPREYPATAAASPRAQEAAPAQVVRALSADAPWFDAGAKKDDGGAAHQNHKGHHHGH